MFLSLFFRMDFCAQKKRRVALCPAFPFRCEQTPAYFIILKNTLATTSMMAPPILVDICA